VRTSGAALFPLGIVALLAALTFWLERAVLFDDGSRSGKNRHDPDFIVDDFKLRRFAADGSLQHSAAAPKMVHYADDDTTEITAPVFNMHGQPPTQMTAQRAWMGKDGKEVRLEGAVRAVRSGEAGSAETIVTTQVLYLYPDDDLAHSDTPTTVTQGRSVLNGAGFEADGKQETFTMKGPVRGTILRREKQPSH
jgi:lipopolysaccharide export system protein LptC